MDIGTLFGLLLGIGLLGSGIIFGESATGFICFINIPAFLFATLGVVASILVAYPLKSVVNAIKSIKIIFVLPKVNEIIIVQRICEMSTISRKEGLLAIEDMILEQDDVFMKKGILAIVDGKSLNFVKNLLEKEIMYKKSRHEQVVGLYIKIGEIAPTWGLLGTVIGLALMFKNFSDISAIGGSMAIALMSTIYGIFIANLLANPIANKLKIKSENEMRLNEITMEGLLAIHAGENTRLIEEKMLIHLEKLKRRTVPKETISFGGEK